MKVLSSSKMILGTLSAAGLMAIGTIACNKKEQNQTALEDAKTELKKAQEQSNQDSLIYVYSDSVKTKEKMAKLKELKKEYLELNNNTIDENTKKMNKKINEVQAQLDIATGKVFQKSKEKVELAKKMVQLEELQEKKNNGTITPEEELLFFKLSSDLTKEELLSAQADLISMTLKRNQCLELLDKIIEANQKSYKKNEVIEEFNKLAK